MFQCQAYLNSQMTTSNRQQTLNLGLVCAPSASVPSEFVKWPPPIPPTHTTTLSWEFRLKRRSGQCTGCLSARPLLICQRTNAYFLTLYACVISLSQYQLFLFDLMLCSIDAIHIFVSLDNATFKSLSWKPTNVIILIFSPVGKSWQWCQWQTFHEVPRAL